jgi:hypothetical protein
MTEIILKTNAPDKAVHILKEALAKEASRIKYSLNLAKNDWTDLNPDIISRRPNSLMNGALKT